MVMETVIKTYKYKNVLFVWIMKLMVNEPTEKQQK